MIPSYGGRFEVKIGDELIYSKLATGEHPAQEYIVKQVQARLGAGA